MVGESIFRKYIWLGLAVFLAGTIFFGYHLRSVRFDYDFEKFFPVNDEETDFFMSYRDKFLSDNDFLLIAIENESGVFDEEFLSKVDRYTKELEKTRDVKFVNSITNSEEYFIFAGGTKSSKAYIDFNDFDVKRDSARIFKNDELINTLVAENCKSVCLFLRHEDYISKVRSDDLIIAVDKLALPYKFDKVRRAGRTVGQKYYIDMMTYEMALFVSLSAILIVFFLYLAFRSGWGILIPQVVIFGAMIWVVGSMGLFDSPINIILSILPSIMFVVSMSDVIHLVSRYLDALRTEDTVFEAIKISVKEVGLATFLTSVTTSIGFFSLYFVSVQPIQVFGIVMGFGVLIAFFITFLVLPILFYLFPGPKHIREKKRDHFWKGFLLRGFHFAMNKWRAILIVASLVIIASVYGISQIKTNNYIMDDISPKDELKQDFDFLDKYYGGIRPFELSIQIKNKRINVWNKNFLQTIDTVENYLQKTYGATVKYSLVRISKVLNRAAHAGKSEYFAIPESQRKVNAQRRAIRIIGQGEFVKSLMDTAEMLTRISGSIPDIGNVVIAKKNKALYSFLERHDMDGSIDYQITGTAHLIDKNIQYLATSLIKGLGVSLLIVALIIGLIYRSGSILVISIITNLFPLIFIGGIMGFFGLELKTSTSIIFTIAFGIAVDDTIHFLGKFKYELLQGKSKLYALKRSYLTTGKAMILTTLILCSGFMLLVFSSFLGTFYMGLLLCITLFVALIADITLLPALLLLFYKPKSKK